MHHQARCLVDHQDGLVFVNHFKGHVFGLGIEQLVNMRFLKQRNHITFGDFLSHFRAHVTVELHVTFFNKFLQARARHLGHESG